MKIRKSSSGKINKPEQFVVGKRHCLEVSFNLNAFLSAKTYFRRRLSPGSVLSTSCLCGRPAELGCILLPRAIASGQQLQCTKAICLAKPCSNSDYACLFGVVAILRCFHRLATRLERKGIPLALTRSLSCNSVICK